MKKQEKMFEKIVVIQYEKVGKMTLVNFKQVEERNVSISNAHQKKYLRKLDQKLSQINIVFCVRAAMKIIQIIFSVSFVNKFIRITKIMMKKI